VAVTAVTRGNIIITENRSLNERTEEADFDLVTRARQGDLAAYGALVEKHKRAVYGIVSRMVSSRDDVDDLVQDIFVLTYRSIGGFRGQSAFNTWLHSIAVNTTIKYLRKMRSRQAVSIDDPEAGVERTLATSGQSGPPDAAEEEERKRAIRNAVEQLPEKHRVVVALHYFDDYSCEEISKILNCSVGTVWSRLHYACKKLRGQLDWLETA
jgi:RNA polymerase sigma-70 factor (ECF subfamily)